MPAFSFTYNGDYDSLDTVTLKQDGSSDSSGTNNIHAFGPYEGMDRFVFNNSPDTTIGGTYFVDANRTEGGFPGYAITKTEYSVSADMSDNTAVVYLEGGDFGDILRAGSSADTLKGGSGNDVLEGGAGGDTIEGGLGIDTASYAHAAGGVYASLQEHVGYMGDAAQDQFVGIENLTGSAHDDSLVGDDGNNTLRGNGGADDIRGLGGDDRIVVSSTPVSIIGDGGKDILIAMGGGTVGLTENDFSGIETIYVRNDTHLDASGVRTGSKIVSQSSSGHGVEILGTSGNDTIRAGKGGDTIDGGKGGDKLFGSAEPDSFHFGADFGRDNLYGLNADHIEIDIAGVDAGDLVLRPLNGGRNTLVTFEGVEAGNKIILHDVTVDDVRAVQSELFQFGA